MIEVLIIATVAILLRYTNVSNYMVYTLNLHSAICQIHFSLKKEKKSYVFIHVLISGVFHTSV